MQHLETCLLSKLKLTQFCVNFLTVFFHWMYKMKCSCYQEYQVLFMASLFIGVLVGRCVACQSQKSVPFVFSRS